MITLVVTGDNKISSEYPFSLKNRRFDLYQLTKNHIESVSHPCCFDINMLLDRYRVGSIEEAVSFV